MERTVIDCNDGMERVFGYPREEVLGKKSELFYPDRAAYDEIERTAIEQIRERGYFSGEITCRRRDGSTFPARGSGSLMRGSDGGPIGIVGVFADRSGWEHMEEALRGQEANLRAIVETASDVIMIIDQQGTIRFINHAAPDLTVEEVVGQSSFRYLPLEYHERYCEALQRAFQASKEDRFRHTAAGRWWDARLAPITRDNQVHAVLVIATDITEGMKAEEALQRYARRLEALRELDRAILTAQSLEQIVHSVLHHAQQLVRGLAVSVTVFDSESGEATVLAQNFKGQPTALEGRGFPLGDFANSELALETLCRGEAYIVEDYAVLSPPLLDMEAQLGEGEYSLISVPLISQGILTGTLNLTTQRGADQEEWAETVREIANLLAIAIQQARLRQEIENHTQTLEQRVADRTRELSTLYAVAAVAAESLDLQSTLKRIVGLTVEAMDCQAGAIHLVDGNGQLCLATAHQIPPEHQARLAHLSGGGLVGWVRSHREPLLVSNIAADPRALHEGGLPGNHSYIGVPIQVGARVLGVVSLCGRVDQPFSVESVALLATITDHVAATVENDRLRNEAEKVVVIEERQRLARELHDASTQSLYSLTLFAQAAQDRLRDGSLDRVGSMLEEILATANQTLKEMRLMLYELRPSILREHGLVKALRHRLDTVERRVGVAGSVVAEGPLEFPSPVEEEFYHIAQEALNNALRHAAATKVAVHVCTEQGRTVLQIRDNGRGFEPEKAVHRGGMGLRNMAERAEKLGGSIDISSKPGHGTVVKVSAERHS
jgi:PAS domain S-box-containing protein